MSQVSQRELAAILHLTTQQIRNLEDKGIPVAARGRRKEYPIPGAVEWYVRFKQEEAVRRAGGGGKGGLAESRARRERARARLAEIEVAQAEGKLIPVEVVEEVFGGRLLDTLRAGLSNLPGRWGAQIIGLTSPREGEAILKRITAELLEDWSGPAADAMEGTPDDDGLPADFPGRALLGRAGIETMEELLAVDDLRDLPGVGPATERKILQALAS